MTVRDWVRNREVHGIPAFSFGELRIAFEEMDYQLLQNELYRLSKQKIIENVYKRFYVVVPPQYALSEMVPPVYYINQLMNYIDKPYYVSLLSAAEIFGAAHQKPQKYFVTTIFPKTNVSKSKNKMLVWNFRNRIKSELLVSRNSETGEVLYSNAELTSVDIVQYAKKIGGLSRAATILSELSEAVNYGKNFEELFHTTTTPTIQRLGFILDDILHSTSQAALLYKGLTRCSKSFKYVLLDKKKRYDSQRCDDCHSNDINERWKIIINTKIEIDDI
ncbi:MAG: type IV toxin-antitoxin system AbiEi family antitoxin [Bacteroidales bacterium]|jgi:predicted transcriptional regulator of viral defense system|nr:type IV toxin-antitoxin system AbiEi family antitoxin [Bacteroidales bacterium]